MEVGYFMMPLHPPESNITKTLEDDIEQIVTLDKLGYKEAWIGEHYTAGWENIPSPDLFIANAIPLTKNIILGTGVNCLTNHNPFTLAHRIAQLDHMAHGRFQWGIGSGGFPGDFEVFRFDPKSGNHRKMFRDSIELILKIWDSPDPGVYEHNNWNFAIPEPIDELNLRVHLKPYQKPHPPIAVAGVSANSDTLVMAGERGWMPISINLAPINTVKTHWEAVEKGAQKSGIHPNRDNWRIAREIYIADTTPQARKDALQGVLKRDAHYFLKLLAHSGNLDLMKTNPDMSDSDINIEYIMNHIWIVGSPDLVTEKLMQLYYDVGGFGMLLAMAHEWNPRDKWVNSMNLLINEVMPKLNKMIK